MSDAFNKYIIWVSLITTVISILLGMYVYNSDEPMKLAVISLSLAFISMGISAYSSMIANKRDREVDKRFSDILEHLNTIDASLKQLCMDRDAEKKNSEIEERKPVHFSLLTINTGNRADKNKP